MRAAIGMADQDVDITTGGLATAIGATGHHLQAGSNGECHLLHLGGVWLQRKCLLIRKPDKLQQMQYGQEAVSQAGVV